MISFWLNAPLSLVLTLVPMFYLVRVFFDAYYGDWLFWSTFPKEGYWLLLTPPNLDGLLLLLFVLVQLMGGVLMVPFLVEVYGEDFLS